MKKSASISLGLLAALTFTLGCKSDDVKACADKQGKVVDEHFCQQQPETSNGQNPHDDHLLRDLLIYRWVFGGNYAGGYVNGYNYYPVPRTNYYSSGSSTGGAIMRSGSAHAFSVSRGGFGSSFHGGGSGE